MAIETSVSGVQTRQPARQGTGRFFANQTYHYETLRALGYGLRGGADVNEVLETTKLVTEGDAQSWYAAWAATAERALATAERTRDAASRGAAFLRAHNYQRTAEFLLPPDDPKRPRSWEKSISSFYRGLDALAVPYQRLTIPYQGASLRALHLSGPAGSERRPLVVLVGGFDSILEELYLALGASALQHGHSVLMYEGPGQGEALREHGLHFTPEWEKPTAAVLDECLRAHPRPARIVLVGMSMGGFFAPRAAAFEERIDGVVAWDTCFDVAELSRPLLAAAADPVAAANPDVQWGVSNACWTLGTRDARETMAAMESYRLAPVAQRIRQDVLILAGTDDHFIPFHQLADFEKALVNANSVTTRIFDRASGGAQHCQAGALGLVDAVVFDWMQETFPEAQH